MKLKSFIMMVLLGGSLLFFPSMAFQNHVKQFKQDTDGMKFISDVDENIKEIDKQELLFWISMLAVLGYAVFLLIMYLDRIKLNLIDTYKKYPNLSPQNT